MCLPAALLHALGDDALTLGTILPRQLGKLIIEQGFRRLSRCAFINGHCAFNFAGRLTAPVAFARQQLVPHLSGFLQLYPQVRIQLDVSDALSSLAAEGYDLAVRHGFQVPETHVAWKLCDTTSVLVATHEYLQRHGKPREPGELSAHNCLFYPRGTDQPAWTFEIAALLADIGRATLPPALNEKLKLHQSLNEAEHRLVERVPELQ